jgi:hypothetical protein
MSNIRGLSAEDVSVLSGRLSGTTIPPKHPKEAKQHLKEIERLRKYERQLMEKEAAANKKRRENLKFAMSEWEAVLPSFVEDRTNKRVQNVWRNFPIPAPYRGAVWSRALGAPKLMSDAEYMIIFQKATERKAMHDQQLLARQAAAAATTPLESSRSGAGPSEGLEETMRKMIDEDPNYFSPRYGKNEAASLIAVDLGRTIIAKAGDGSPGSPHVPGGTPVFDPRGGASPPSSSRSEPSTPGRPEDGESAPSHQRLSSVGGDSDFGETSVGGCSESPPSNNLSFATMTVVEALGKNANLISRLEMCLRCFVEYRPDMGYVQGMSYLAAMILLNLDDREAFLALAALLTRGHFPYFYTVNPQGMSAHIAVFDQVVKEGSPDVARNLTIIGVNPQMYVIDWWMSLWSRALPYEIASRCWDLYLCDDAYLYRISYCILVYFSFAIHEDSALDEVMSFLTKLYTQSIDEERFFCLVNDPKLGPNTTEIRQYMNVHLQILSGLSSPTPNR